MNIAPHQKGYSYILNIIMKIVFGNKYQGVEEKDKLEERKFIDQGVWLQKVLILAKGVKCYFLWDRISIEPEIHTCDL